jgi:hypothetical protein
MLIIQQELGKQTLFFFWEAVLVVELRALCLLGRCSTTWTTPSDLCALVIFEIGSCLMAAILLFVPLHIAGMTGEGHQAQPLVKMVGARRVPHELFAWAVLKPQSSQSHLPSSEDYRLEPPWLASKPYSYWSNILILRFLSSKLPWKTAIRCV